MDASGPGAVGRSAAGDGLLGSFVARSVHLFETTVRCDLGELLRKSPCVVVYPIVRKGVLMCTNWITLWFSRNVLNHANGGPVFDAEKNVPVIRPLWAEAFL